MNTGTSDEPSWRFIRSRPLHHGRVTLSEHTVELPTGGAEAGEEPADTAARECREEVGLDPVRLEPLATYFANPGSSAPATSRIHPC